MSIQINGFARDHERSARQMAVENSATASRMSSRALPCPLPPRTPPARAMRAAHPAPDGTPMTVFRPFSLEHAHEARSP